MWQEVFRVDEEHGRLLLKPELLAIGRDGIFVFDYGNRELSAFTMTGRFAWVRGRKGGGPGEFGGPTDMSTDANGGIYLLDPTNSRITVYSENGTYQRAVTLDQPLHRLAVRRDGSFVGSPMSDKLLVTMGADGTPGASAAPPAELRSLSPLLRENRLLVTSRDQLLMLHTWSTKVILAHLAGGVSVERIGDLRNVQPFPALKTYASGKYTISRVDPASTRVMRAAAVQGDTLFVTDHRDDENTAYIDSYVSTTLQYASSRRSPASLKAFALKGSLLVGLVDEPVPGLVAWRWVPEGRRSGTSTRP
jgi:hypothetical protein